MPFYVCYESYRAKSSMESMLEKNRIRNLGHKVLLDLDNPVPPVFTHAESIVGTGGLGLSKATSYGELVENYRQLLCRRCFTYDCKNHFIAQPPPRVRQDPLPSFPCPVPGLALPSDPLTVNGQRKISRALKGKDNGAQFILPISIAAKSSSSSVSSSAVNESNKTSFIESFGQTLIAAVTTKNTTVSKIAPLTLSSLASRSDVTTNETETNDTRSQSNSIEEITDYGASTHVVQQVIPDPPPFMLYRHLLMSTNPITTTSDIPSTSSSSSSSSNSNTTKGNAAAKKAPKRATKAAESIISKQAIMRDIPWTDVEIAIVEKLTNYGSKISK